jgi:LytS/YehU family sensor histidine kinase
MYILRKVLWVMLIAMLMLDYSGRITDPKQRLALNILFGLFSAMVLYSGLSSAFRGSPSASAIIGIVLGAVCLADSVKNIMEYRR